jgi:hypothetical protein
MAFNIIIPSILKNNPVKFIKWTRVGYFIFWAVWAMVLFGGLVVFMFQKQAIPSQVILMIVATIILPFLDGYRAIKQGKIWRASQGKELALKFSNTIIAIELLIVVAVSLYSYYM